VALSALVWSDSQPCRSKFVQLLILLSCIQKCAVPIPAGPCHGSGG